MAKNYYLILGIRSTASQAVIRKAFRHLAKKYHPDLNPGSRFAEEKFKSIAEAYQVLGTPSKRKEYDRQLGKRVRERKGTPPPPGAAAAKEGKRPAARGSTRDARKPLRRWGMPQPGEDVVQEIEVSFECAAKGGPLRAWVEQDSLCPRCVGSGAREGSAVRTCRACQGTGTQAARPSGSIPAPCSKCDGRGILIKELCPRCTGAGFVSRRLQVAVKIPPGANHGTRVVLRGQGRPGKNLGPRGDLIFVVRVKPHTHFRRLGQNIETTVWIDIVTAALGGSVLVPTLNGNAWITVPPGTRSGTRLSLQGKGMPGPDGQCGDLVVVVGIQTPKKLTERQEQLLKELRLTLPRSQR